MQKIGGMAEYAGVNSTDAIWFNYRMMQVFDRLSLFFCCNYDLEKAADGESRSQRDHDYGAAFYRSTINPTPTRFGEEDCEMDLAPLGKTRLRVHPYPFDVAPLKVSVRGRVVPRQRYESQEQIREVYSRQPRAIFEYTLVPE
jgi:hypothetical protein